MNDFLTDLYNYISEHGWPCRTTETINMPYKHT